MNDITRKFDHRIKNPDPHIVALLAEIDGIRGEFKGGLRMTPQAITNLKRSTLITSAGASTRIEGAKLTDEKVEDVMRGLAVSKFADRDSQEVQGYLETLQNVFDSYQSLPLRELSLALRHRVDSALSRGSVTALALLAFSAVAREGIETTLFLFAGSTNSSGMQFVAGGLLGFAIAGAVGVACYYGAARLPLRQFFLVTGVIVVVLAAGMLANSLNALHEAALITDLGSRPWDSETTISMTSTMGKFLHTVLGYDSAPAVAQIFAYWAYMVIVLGGYLFLPTRTPVRARPIEAPITGVIAES